MVPAEGWPEGPKPVWTGGAADPRSAVDAYRQATLRKSEVERQMDDRSKTGVFTGAFATNPLTGQPIPVFVADYVLMGYGTGAIMGVPGQDERDWAYALAFDLPIVRTVQPADGHPEDEAYVGEGPAINSANDEISLNGLGVDDAKSRIIEFLEARGIGHGTVNYRLRDWLFSRQRYWGEPFPIVYDETGTARALPDSMLPLALPDVPDYAPKTFDPNDAESSPEPPLSRVPEWVEVELDLGDGLRKYRRETNTMPNWADPVGTTCDTWTPPTTTRSVTLRTSGTGWPSTRIPSRARPPASPTRRGGPLHRWRRTRRSSTCCTPASGTRCCSTWAWSRARSRSGSTSPRG
jgi:leucyl-tRNA synthetase